MLKETITYTDFNGTERTEEFWFNLTQTELIKMFDPKKGNPTDELKEALVSNDLASLLIFFGDLMVQAYGEKSADGRRFVKSPEISEAFARSAAFEALYTKLTNDEAGIVRFIRGIIPTNLENQINFDQLTGGANGVLPIS